MSEHRAARLRREDDTAPLPDCDAVHGYVGKICFKTGPPTRVGAELEWLVHRPHVPNVPVPLDLLRSLLESAGPLPGGGTISYEPGGQLEVSSRPAAGLGPCLTDLRSDLRHLRTVLARAGIAFLPSAIDPFRHPRRQLRRPRYDAMEIYFDRRGRYGRIMMCSTAAIQVNLDAGADPDDVARRWRLLNALGPVMTAAFANSPVAAGRPTGWKSTRQWIWQCLDPPRTAPLRTGADPVTAWAEYALDAPVMAVRRDDAAWIADPGMTFRQWVTGTSPAARDVGRPTEDDLAYHLTTLFPPVRPRGWLEVRYIDAQAPTWWPVPVAVLTALTDDAQAADTASAAVKPVAGRWKDAARSGLADPALARAARTCFEAALDGLRRAGTDDALIALVEAYAETYVRQGRCPADDVLGPPRSLAVNGATVHPAPAATTRAAPATPTAASSTAAAPRAAAPTPPPDLPTPRHPRGDRHDR